jgi:hypothetical protein
VDRSRSTLPGAADSRLAHVDGRLSRERLLLRAAKGVTAFLLDRATAHFGRGFAVEQEIIGHLADMAIEIYAVESAILRAEKMAAGGAFHALLAEDVARVYTADAAERVEHAARNALAAIDTRDVETRAEEIHRLLRHGPVNTIAARRRIADAVIAANRYPL